MSGALSFQTEVFEGPLDLLLHLVKKNRVDIFDIPMVEITAQYFEYLTAAQNADMDISAEFLVTAAELLYIKSRLLLPRAPVEQEEDPRAELAQRLCEYKKIKEAAALLGKTQHSAEKLFFKEAEEIGAPPVFSPLDISVEELIAAFLDVRERNLLRAPPPASAFSGVIKREKVSISRQARHIWERLKTRQTLRFEQIFEGLGSKPQYIATFLALLEMVKQGRVSVYKEKGAVVLKKRGGFDGVKSGGVSD